MTMPRQACRLLAAGGQNRGGGLRKTPSDDQMTRGQARLVAGSDPRPAERVGLAKAAEAQVTAEVTL